MRGTLRRLRVGRWRRWPSAALRASGWGRPAAPPTPPPIAPIVTPPAAPALPSEPSPPLTTPAAPTSPTVAPTGAMPDGRAGHRHRGRNVHLVHAPNHRGQSDGPCAGTARRLRGVGGG